jgi:hypothetical protein
MIELTEQQLQALEGSGDTPLRVMNPRTKETFVLIRIDDFERLKEDEYDDSPWTREELQALAWEVGKHAGWEDQIVSVPRATELGCSVPSRYNRTHERGYH